MDEILMSSTIDNESQLNGNDNLDIRNVEKFEDTSKYNRLLSLG